jgi:hypothetical protein
MIWNILIFLNSSCVTFCQQAQLIFAGCIKKVKETEVKKISLLFLNSFQVQKSMQN